MVSPEGCEGVLEELEKEIHNINSLVSIIRSVRCQVDLPKLLNCRAYDATVSLTNLSLLFICWFVFLVHTDFIELTLLIFSPFQHATHLEALLEESRSLSTRDIHDSGVRTLCISEPRQVDLDKVVF